MLELKTKSFFLFLAFMLMITTFLPIVSAYSRFNIGVHRTWVYLWFISLIFLSPRTFTDKFFFYVLCFSIIFVYFLLNTLWRDVREWDKGMDKDSIIDILTAISLYTYFNTSKDFEGLALLVKWTLIFITITAILTINASIVDPMYARKIVGGEFTREELSVITKLGGGWYGFAGALGCLFPVIIYYYRKSNKVIFSKPIILVFGILCFTAIIRIQIFANIIIAVIAIIFSLFGAGRIRKFLIFSGIFLGLILFIPKNFYSEVLVNASGYFNPDSDINYKLNDMSRFVKLGEVSNETGAGGRVERYPLLWEGFKSNPITGIYNSKSTLDIASGGHLYWMNKLTVYGILGFVPFFLIFYFYIKKVLKQIDSEFAFYFLLSIFSGIGLGLMKSLFGADFWCMLFFIIPSLYYLPLLKKQPTNFRELI
jgi:hypothetical protein